MSADNPYAFTSAQTDAPLSDPLGVMLLAQLFPCYAISSVTLLAGGTINPFILPTALITGWTVTAAGQPRSVRFRMASWGVAVWSAAIAAACVLCDFSYDGNAYHQEITAALCNGWNPTRIGQTVGNLSVWTLHYANGLETIAADVVSLTGSLESGKAVNLVIATSGGCIIFSFIRRYFPELKPTMASAIALLAVLNPVFVTQAGTYYNDFAKYFYTVMTILLVIKTSSAPDKKPGYACLFMVICLAIATKFNAFFEEGVVISASLVWLIFHRKQSVASRLLILSALAATAGVLLFSYHPYVTNTLSAGHPLFPLMGNGSEEIMSGNTPDEFTENNRFTNFFYSMTYALTPRYDSRFGGFGPFFAVMLAVSLVAMWRSRSPKRGLTLYISAWTIASCFFFEQSWWARYICQAWLLFPLGALAAATSATEHHATGWLLACGALTTGLCLTSYTESFRTKAYRNAIYTTLHGDTVSIDGLNQAYERQLSEHGITATPATERPDSAFPLPYFGNMRQPDAYPIMYLPKAKRDSIAEKLRSSIFSYPQVNKSADD